jgi:hypothetical protein
VIAIAGRSSHPAVALSAMWMALDEGVKKLVEILAALTAVHVGVAANGGGTATRAEPAATPVECVRSSIATPQDEDLRESIVHGLAKWHVARGATEGSILNRHRLAAFWTKHGQHCGEGGCEVKARRGGAS